MSIKPDARTHRVAQLRSDEVAHLNREAADHRGANDCCPHLDVFHRVQYRPDGSHWRTCKVRSCGCLEDTEPSELHKLYAQREADQARHDRIAAAVVWPMLGIALGVTITALATMLGAL